MTSRQRSRRPRHDPLGHEVAKAAEDGADRVELADPLDQGNVLVDDLIDGPHHIAALETIEPCQTSLGGEDDLIDHAGAIEPVVHRSPERGAAHIVAIDNHRMRGPVVAVERRPATRARRTTRIGTFEHHGDGQLAGGLG